MLRVTVALSASYYTKRGSLLLIPLLLFIIVLLNLIYIEPKYVIVYFDIYYDLLRRLSSGSLIKRLIILRELLKVVESILYT